MSFLEEEYLRRVSYKLRNFKSKGGHLYQFSCPVCGDSKTSTRKARGYAFDKCGSLIIHCHKCAYGASFPSFLKDQDALLYKEFVMERFKQDTTKEVRHREYDDLKIVATKKYIPDIFSSLPLASSFSLPHEAAKFISDRKIPVDQYQIYYAEKFIEWSNTNSIKFKDWKGDDHSRIVIPFKSRDGRIIGYTARSLNGEEPKYYRIFVSDSEKEKFFGLDRLDETKQVYVVEGEIDSMFLPNGLAVSNGKLETYLNKSAIYIADKDVRNKHIMKNVSEMIEHGLNVCMLPDDLVGKDINEFVVAGYTQEQLLKVIHTNTFSGLKAKLKFKEWSKV